MTTEARPVTAADLAEFTARLQGVSDTYFAKQFPTLTPSRFAVDTGGRKFKRIVRSDADGSQRSVWGFVEVTTGLIWKAATWKAPARNFPRGSIFDPSRALDPYSAG